VNIALWILQVILAILYVRHGLLLLSPPESAQAMVAAMNFLPGLSTFIGAAELLAAIGLVLPGLTRLMPWLTPLAAAALALLMTGALFYHLSRGETGLMLYTGFLLILAAFLAYARWKIVPLPNRSA
jgi:uncharacterized membrane protein YphA (DoxX/SURF4 family)